MPTNNNLFNKIFQKSSTTFYYSSLLFPDELQAKISILYAFVRTVDNFVDQKTQDKTGFYQFCNAFEQARNNPNFQGFKLLDNSENDKILKSFVVLEQEFGFEKTWTDHFLYAMDLDLNQKTYTNMRELTDYMYGSASVIGLYICKILNLPSNSYPFAQTLGTAFQYINFIRDINEDITVLGRVYIPQDELHKYNLKELTVDHCMNHRDSFVAFMGQQIQYFREWQKKGLEGLEYLPKQSAIAVKTAADCYEWTAKKILHNPYIVFKTKVKPSKIRILFYALQNWRNYGKVKSIS
jgi:15-cis-phytoene synthase